MFACPYDRVRLRAAMPETQIDLNLSPEEIKSALVRSQRENLILKSQLKSVGANPVDLVPLAEAERLMREAVNRLMGGDESAEAEVERWDQSIRMNPEYIQREEKRAQAWDDENQAICVSCLRLMRTLVPPDVNECGVDTLVARGLPERVAKRVLAVKALWLVRVEPKHISKLHIAELSSKYSPVGLDIVEMRAIYQVLPVEFDNDSDGKKIEWKNAIRLKLMELTDKEKNGSLGDSSKRHRDYRDADDLHVFNPDSGSINMSHTKCTAFKPAEKPVVRRSSRFLPSFGRQNSSLGANSGADAAPPPPAEEPRPGFLASIKDVGKMKRRTSL